MSDKRCSLDDVVAALEPGMTIGIGGWGSRRKPMALVRAICRSTLTDLTVVSYAGPDVGMLCAAGKVRRLVFAFASLDSIPLEPHVRAAREGSTIAATELDEGMFQWGLLAAAHRLPFLPIRAGLGSDVLRVNPEIRTVTSPYADAEELVAAPALRLDAALVHVNRADAAGNGQLLGVDPFFDDLFCAAADRAYLSTEQVVPTADFLSHGPLQTLRIPRINTHGVVLAPHGAHPTTCDPDYGRDEQWQRGYAASADSPEAWASFRARWVDVSEADYQRLRVAA